ncbi:CaiB/BaiF CoA transferase family protein [Candidatus Poriferisocius sp.]|uniref:CaiB/BaiF CoA transferase family protein n=1 Tax=Candidatus Poriferisocius sp. TaxID=3101276 RepID=UPI003B024589
MEGIKVLEVAQFTFTPAAGAVLADWGADVMKVEHAVTGDAQRGLKIGTGGAAAGSFQPLMEHPNRGKRSVGIALETEAGRALLDELIAESDVFLTNFLPAARRKLRIEVDDVRAVNPSIVYARGSALGPRGPESEDGGYDGSTFWCRAGSAWGGTAAGASMAASMPSGAYGDSMGGMTIAGGIAAALLKRERTGEASVVDVSLLSVGAWATALSIGTALLLEENPPKMPVENMRPAIPVNPVIGTFPTSDGRFINFTMLQPGRYWADVCRHIDREDLIDDPRFDTDEKLIENAIPAGDLVAEAIAAKPYDHWVEKFETLEGQWAKVQSPLEVADDPQVRANGYILMVQDLEGNDRELVSSPVQFDEAPYDVSRAPQFAEHTDEIVLGLGKSEDELIQLKIDGAIT